MLTLIFSVALLGRLMVNVQSQGATWNNCKQNVVDSVRGVVGRLAKNPITLQNISVCEKLIMNFKDLKDHPVCGVKNCDWNAPDCKEQRMSFHIKHMTFRCEIEDTGLIVKEIIKKLPTLKAKEGLTLDGAWLDLVVTLIYRVTCTKGKGAANMTKSEMDSKPRSLSVSCSEGTEAVMATCNNVFRTEAARDVLSKLAEKTLDEKVIRFAEKHK